jgi:putative ABC transport system permease protein
VAHISPEIVLETDAIKNGLRRSTKLVGVEQAYFRVYNFDVSQGKLFTDAQVLRGDNVCIIGENIRAKFFSQENPIGKQIKCGNIWLKVVGVLEEKRVSGSNLSKLGIRDFNSDIYTPLQTMLSRYQNRSLVTNAMIQRAANSEEEGGGNKNAKNKNYHQLDKLVIQIGNTEQLNSSAEIISRMLERRHYKVVDYEITIPELLLKQQQRTKDIFNIVLGAIAGISLLVGGIGIMNIMLASVLERIKEIGLRLSIGAKKSDIVLQFLFEAMMISLSGGIIGVILGVIMAVSIAKVADIPTIISGWSVCLSFVIAAGVGLIFGIAPARRAAEQDPIASLRYE